MEGLCYFGIYRLIVSKSQRYAHNFRAGIIGMVAFGACGVHVPCIMTVWIYNFLLQKAPNIAYECSLKFSTYFMIPATVLFLIFCIYMIAVQILVFVKEMTPYPRWCWIFNIGFGMAATMIIATPFRGYEWGNALAAAWISVGNIWQFAGLLIMMKKINKQYLK